MSPSALFLVHKLRAARNQLHYLPRALRLVWTATRAWTMAWGVLLVMQGLLPAGTVYLTRLLVDSLVGAVGAHGDMARVQPALLWAALMGGILLLTELLRSLTGLVRTAQADLVQDYITGLLHAKSTAIDFAFYESPDYFDHLHRARTEATYRPLLLLESLGGLLQNGLTLLAMAAVLLPYGLWLPLALFFSALPAFCVVLRYSLRQHQFWLRTTADQRRSEYYDWLLTTGDTAAEIRLFGLDNTFQTRYQSLRRGLRGERLRLAMGESLAGLGAGALALLLTGGAMAWMVWRALQGQVTLGGLALFYSAFSQGQTLARSLLEHVGQIYANSLFLSHLFEFLGLQPRVTDPPNPLPTPDALTRGICFQGVTFRYPGSERLALENFDLTIPAGQIVAIVGANGAGKSTLIKLLCRLYDPDAGLIEMDGCDLRRLRLADLRRRITVLFQQPVRYSATVAENISLGGVPNAPVPAPEPIAPLRQTRLSKAEMGLQRAARPILKTMGQEEVVTPGAEVEDAIARAAQQAGADTIIAHLPQGYDNLLGKWFAGGAELSGGEWQRIALARAFYRQASLLLLDEPTSAMDSWAEEAWLQRFRLLAGGRTVVVITHRFTTAMRADVIHVMEDGHIVESGSHEELLARGGRYARSWQAQMRAAAPSRPEQPAPSRQDADDEPRHAD